MRQPPVSQQSREDFQAFSSQTKDYAKCAQSARYFSHVLNIGIKNCTTQRIINIKDVLEEHGIKAAEVSGTNR